ncbi:hypothetical protein LC065_20220 (plasmid) [Halobacillus litoralis]|uniref:hypothetical protein n=1 Tax=Halobacillus litoralis TaxID=45668 RepID=UPI001CFDAD84|nr:hypothetical protein [Halobacillus litoralis]WLR49572.1 hypothetical protein LC065_20220 [Halobacillus litoralis]
MAVESQVLDLENKHIFIGEQEGSELMRVSIFNYDREFYYVSTRDPQQALDEVVDYLEAREETGHFYSMEEAEQLEKEDGMEFLTAGNHCWQLDPEHTQVEEWMRKLEFFI